MHILVVIASHGSQNDAYLERVLAEYRSMPYQVDVIVLSNIHKDCGPGVEVRVGLPTKDPYSLPFGHKRVFVEHLNNYDLFIYSEDDILITTENIEAFLKQSAFLPQNQVPGFLRIEKGASGKIQYCDMHAAYHWDSQSVRTSGEYTFAFFTNEHAGCYILTRRQFQYVLDSGRFLVEPHKGKYGMLEAAATDPYTQCGLKKMICISHLDTSSVHHLPNKYFERFGLPEKDLRAQIDALLQIERNGGTYEPLIQMEHQLSGCLYLRDHYEPVRTEISSLITKDVRSILSFGCGETEVALAQQGIRVVAVPVDAVVSAAAAEKGVELVLGDLKSVMTQLHGQSFDCLLFLNVLHLVKEPIEIISSFMRFLRKDGVIITLSPHLSDARFLGGWLIRKESRKSYREAGVNIVSPGLLQKWFKRVGARPEMLTYVPLRGQKSGIPQGRFLSAIIAKEFILRARQRADLDLG